MQFTLWHAGPPDRGFLYRLYEGTRGQQFAQIALPPAQLEALVRMQFSAQQTGYRDQYPRSLDESAAEIAIVDIAILPEYQRCGLGTAVLARIVNDAARVGKTVRLRVDRMNFGAARLYRRLGFEVVSGNDVCEEMELLPGKCPRATSTG